MLIKVVEVENHPTCKGCIMLKEKTTDIIGNSFYGVKVLVYPKICHHIKGESPACNGFKWIISGIGGVKYKRYIKNNEKVLALKSLLIGKPVSYE